MAGGVPAISGPELCKLLVDDGWTLTATGKHGRVLIKAFPDGTRTTVVPSKSNKPLPPGTLGAILGSKQTGLGKRWLRRQLGL